MPKVSLQSINTKLDRVLKNQKSLLQTEQRVERKENEELREEAIAEKELKNIERLEREIEKQVESHPLRKITIKDVARGAIGAFVGTVAHYTFIYGIKVAEAITVMRASLLFPLSFIVGGIFLYATGFRKVQDPKLLWFLPVRLIVLSITAIITSIIVLAIFTPSFGQHFGESFKQVATVSLSAIIGACTADVLGKD
ncbi:MAG: hypothetical protein Q7K43_03840 [Candidatus Woesearchaeota archaeon]|nr:hypothetical protein [Candidatus Woesearchaeota archaeon]